MRPIHVRRFAGIAIALTLTLSACSFNNGYVTTVTIAGGDRTLALGDALTLSATVTNRAGATDRVTWTTSDDAIATIDANGLVSTNSEGATQITATSASDPSKSDTITLTITEANAVTNLTIDGGDRTIVLGDPLSLTATITTTGNAADAITWTSSDEAVATIDAAGNVTSHTDGTTDLTATSTTDPSKNDTITLTVDPPGALRWARQFGTGNGERVYGVAADGNGNAFVAGRTTGALGGPFGGSQDAFLRAYDPDGNVLWTRQFGDSADEEAYGVATDANGNVYVTGYGNVGDAFVRAYDPDGNIRWTRQFGTTASESGWGVATDASGNVYVTGNTSGALEGPNVGSDDAFLRAYDTDGNVLWTRQFGTTGNDAAYDVATDASGYIYVTGYTTGALEGPNVGSDDAFLRAYDTDGNVLWTRQFGTTTGDLAWSVATDANSNAYVTGYTDGALEGPNSGNRDAFLRAYDPNGNVRWTRQFGTTADDLAWDVATDANGNAYVTGDTTGDLESPNAGSTDAFLRTYDTDGNVRWTRQFGTSTDDTARAVAIDASGRAYVAGETFGSLEGPSAGSVDGFVRSYGR